MSIPLVLGFNRGMASPLDVDFQKADITARNAIINGKRFEGMQCYVVSEGKTYSLVGGIANNNWQDLKPADGATGLSSVGLHTFNFDASMLYYDVGTAYFDDSLGVVFPVGDSSSMLVKFSPPRKWDTESLYCQIDWTHDLTQIEVEGDVDFILSAKSFANLSPISESYGTPRTLTDTGGLEPVRYLTAQSSNIPIGGYPSKNSEVWLKIARSSTDTLVGDVYLQRIVVFYNSDQPTDDLYSITRHILPDEANGLLYISSGSKGIEVVDISTPSNPILIDSYDSGGFVKRTQIIGSYLYEIDTEFGLRIYSITSAGVLELAGSLVVRGIRNMVINSSGEIAFISCRDDTIASIDISAKETPILISRDNAGGLNAIDGLGIDNGILYVCAGNLYAFDLALFTTSLSTALVGTFAAAGTVSICFSGLTAYIAKGSAGLEAIDITTPSAMTSVNTYNGTGNALSVTTDGINIFSADRFPGVRKLSLALVYESVLDANGEALSVAVESTNFYISNGLAGITIADKATMLPISYFSSN
jgi:hypothetical protein